MDAEATGSTLDLRTSITALGLRYGVAGIQSHTTVWAPGTGPRPPKKWSGHGRPPKLMRRDNKHKPASVKELALALAKAGLAHGSHGGKPLGTSCPRDLPVCAFASRIGIIGSPTVGQKEWLLIEMARW